MALISKSSTTNILTRNSWTSFIKIVVKRTEVGHPVVMNHFLILQDLSTIYTVSHKTPCLDECSAKDTLHYPKHSFLLTPMQSKLVIKYIIIIHLGCSNNTSPNPWLLSARSISAAGTKEHNLLVPIQVMHHYDMEISHSSFVILVSRSWNSLPSRSVGEPSPEGLQQFKNVAHHLLKNNWRWVLNADFLTMFRSENK